MKRQQKLIPVQLNHSWNNSRYARPHELSTWAPWKDLEKQELYQLNRTSLAFKSSTTIKAHSQFYSFKVSLASDALVCFPFL